MVVSILAGENVYTGIATRSACEGRKLGEGEEVLRFDFVLGVKQPSRDLETTLRSHGFTKVRQDTPIISAFMAETLSGLR